MVQAILVVDPAAGLNATTGLDNLNRTVKARNAVHALDQPVKKGTDEIPLAKLEDLDGTGKWCRTPE